MSLSWSLCTLFAFSNWIEFECCQIDRGSLLDMETQGLSKDEGNTCVSESAPGLSRPSFSTKLQLASLSCMRIELSSAQCISH